MAGLSKVAIWNLALNHIGAKRVSSASEKTVEARQCDLIYDFCRRLCLEDYNWTFARQRATLAELSETVTGWEYVYALPSDCLVPRELSKEAGPVLSGEAPIEYEIEKDPDTDTKWILTNEEDAKLIYTADVTNEAVFTYKFAMALSFLMASMLAIRLRGKEKFQEKMYTMYDLARPSSQAEDGDSEKRKVDEVSDFINSR